MNQMNPIDHRVMAEIREMHDADRAWTDLQAKMLAPKLLAAAMGLVAMYVLL